MVPVELSNAAIFPFYLCEMGTTNSAPRLLIRNYGRDMGGEYIVQMYYLCQRVRLRARYVIPLFTLLPRETVRKGAR
jgi:hypothetical protein